MLEIEVKITSQSHRFTKGNKKQLYILVSKTCWIQYMYITSILLFYIKLTTSIWKSPNRLLFVPYFSYFLLCTTTFGLNMGQCLSPCMRTKTSWVFSGGCFYSHWLIRSGIMDFSTSFRATFKTNIDITVYTVNIHSFCPRDSGPIWPYAMHIQ